MIEIRPSAERGAFKNAWLDAKYSFSFNNYYDPRRMGFRALRVINEDRFGGGQGFGMHPHDNMEILTWVNSGALAHRDSTGGEGQIGPGELQAMSAGSGLMHSEFNASKTEPVHLFQIWIHPDKEGVRPGYSQKTFDRDARRNQLQLVASPTGEAGSLKIEADAKMYALILEAGQTVKLPVAPDRGVWVQVAAGSITVNGQPLATGDGAAIEQESEVVFTAQAATELIAFDLK
ncbi:MAG: pirin family protein [Bryobacteraceae bacterium]|nr:pirin family protein [Bryobacteraceae bacterium]